MPSSACAPKTASVAAVLIIAAASFVGTPAAWADEAQVPAQGTGVVAEAAGDDSSVVVGEEEAPTDDDALGTGEDSEGVGGGASGDAPDEPLAAEAVTQGEVTTPVPGPGTEEPLVEPEAGDDEPSYPVASPSVTVEPSPVALAEAPAPVEEGEDESALAVTVTASRVYVSTVGERIDLRVQIRNSGRAVLTDIAVVNNLNERSAHCGVRALAPGESATCTVVYRVTGADLADRRLRHELIAKGVTPQNGEVTTRTTSTTYVAPIPPEPVAPQRVGN